VNWKVLSREARAVLGLVLLLAPSNLEMLQLVPWNDQGLNGFPTTRLVALGAVAVFLGDPLQLALQTYFIATVVDKEEPYASIFALSVLSLVLAAASIWSRGLRKLLILCSRMGPPTSPHEVTYWPAVGTSAAPQPVIESGLVATPVAPLPSERALQPDDGTPHAERAAMPMGMAARKTAMRWLAEVSTEAEHHTSPVRLRHG
jgi:hypothetical protein